jgi:hypothetical protein
MFHRKNLRYLVPSGMTAPSLGLALFALIKASTGEYQTAAWIIVWYALLDRMDGVTVTFPVIIAGIIAIDDLGAARALPLLPLAAAVAYSILGFVFGTVRKSRENHALDTVRIDQLQTQSATWSPRNNVQATSASESLERVEESPTHEQCQSTEMSGAFRKEGEYWTVAWAKSESKLKHRKGLDYIAYLLRHPGQEFGAIDLISAIQPGGLAKGSTSRDGTHQEHDGIARSLGDAGAILDATAKEQYKRRLQDLREDLESAERDNDLSGADKARAEIEFIEGEVVAAVGLGGRDRKSSSHAERARLAVTKAIKTAISRIREVDSELGKHLSLSIQTGYFCTYVPAQPITWRL